MTLWEPTTATQRVVQGRVEGESGELVVPLNEIRGEVVWVSNDGWSEIRRTVIDKEVRITEEHVPSSLRECGQPIEKKKITHVAEWEPESTSKRGEALLLRMGLVERPQRIPIEFILDEGEIIATPRIHVKRRIERAVYKFVLHAPEGLAKYLGDSRLRQALDNGLKSLERLEMADAAFSDADGNELSTVQATDDLKPVTDCDLAGDWLMTTGDAYLPLSSLSRKITIVALPGTKPRQYTFKSEHDCGTDIVTLTEDNSLPGSGQSYIETVEKDWTCEPTSSLCCEWNPTIWTLGALGVLHRTASGTDYGHVLDRTHAKEFLMRSTWARRS